MKSKAQIGKRMILDSLVKEKNILTLSHLTCPI
jgi:hypothetical protein